MTLHGLLQSKWRLFIQFFDILVIELQIYRCHVQTRMPQHLLQSSNIPPVSHAVYGKRVSEGMRVYVFSNNITIALDNVAHLPLFELKYRLIIEASGGGVVVREETWSSSRSTSCCCSLTGKLGNDTGSGRGLTSRSELVGTTWLGCTNRFISQ
jgi:hypothetical protein